MLDRIPELRLIHESIHDIHVRLLCLESSKHPVPDDEDSSIVLVQTVSVGSVVDLVVAGCVEDIVQWPQGGHQLGVDPELVEQVELLVDHGVTRRHKKGQGQVERLEIMTRFENLNVDTVGKKLVYDFCFYPAAKCLEG